MSELSPDVIARGRAIFERLRGAPLDEPEPGDDGFVADETPTEAEQPALPVPDDLAIPAMPAAPAPLELPAEPAPTSPPAAEPVLDGPAVVPDLQPQATPVVESEPTPLAAREPAREPEPEAPPPPAPSRFARPLPRILAVANQKGGVGKTTTTVNLAACLADHGYRVLVVDLDPQGNASTGLGINIRDLATSMYDVLLHDVPLEDAIEPTSVRGLFVAPANLELAGAEIELVPAFSRELKLRTALASVRDDYDYVLIDCPPSLGLLTVNSLAAASEVLVPIQCESYALAGLGQLMRNVGLVQKSLNPVLEVSVIVCVMYDARTKLADQVVQEVRSHFGEKVCRTVIPRTVRLSEAPSYGQPISAFDPTSRGAIAYRELAKEVSGGGTAQRAG